MLLLPKRGKHTILEETFLKAKNLKCLKLKRTIINGLNFFSLRNY